MADSDALLSNRRPLPAEPEEALPTREVLVPSRGTHLVRAFFMLPASALWFAFAVNDMSPDYHGRYPPELEFLLAGLCLLWGLYFLLLAFRARVVLSLKGLTYCGVGPNRRIDWSEVTCAATMSGVRQGGMPLMKRVGVSVLRTDGSSFWLPGFDSGSTSAMDAVTERIMFWRTRSGLPEPHSSGRHRMMRSDSAAEPTLTTSAAAEVTAADVPPCTARGRRGP